MDKVTAILGRVTAAAAIGTHAMPAASPPIEQQTVVAAGSTRREEDDDGRENSPPIAPSGRLFVAQIAVTTPAPWW
jgi:hypothetical protein